MFNVFKAGGPYKAGDVEYSIRSIREKDLQLFLDKGWATSLDTLPIEGECEEVLEEGSEYEATLRAKIKELGGTAGGRSSIETLEKKLSELENGNDN